MSTHFDDAQFEATSETGWRRLAEKALSGESFERLVSRTDDGVAYGPVHPRRAPARPIPRGDAASGWRIVQRIDDPDPARANAQALVDLEAGADALSLVFAGGPSAHGFGLPMTADAVGAALAGVALDIVHLRIEPHADAAAAIEILRRLAEKRGLAPGALDLDLCLDGIGPRAVAGGLPGDEARWRADAGCAARIFVESGLAGRLAEADGRVYHEAGASEAQELGAVLAAAVWQLRAMEEVGMELSAAAAAIGFTLAADQKQLLVTAKLRALRLLWRRVLELADASDPAPARIHAETSFRMMAAMDPHTNILRTTVAAFAAAVGGADSISVLPFTLANGLPEAKARRLARNTQVILREEAGLGRVGDPGAGSGGIETLTDGLAAAGWEEFRRIEAEGGIVASLAAGTLQARIAATREMRAERREAVIGVTLYPLDRELDIPVLMPRARAARGDAPAVAGRSPPLAPRRLSEDMEAA